MVILNLNIYVIYLLYNYIIFDVFYNFFMLNLCLVDILHKLIN